MWLVCHILVYNSIILVHYPVYLYNVLHTCPGCCSEPCPDSSFAQLLYPSVGCGIWVALLDPIHGSKGPQIYMAVWHAFMWMNDVKFTLCRQHIHEYEPSEIRHCLARGGCPQRRREQRVSPSLCMYIARP